MNIGHNIKNLRQEMNLSQKELANKLGYSRSTIANYEKNNRLPSIKAVNKLADFFNVSVDYLLNRSDIRLNINEYIMNKKHLNMLLINPETGKILNCSKAALNFYGYNKKEMLNKSIFEINTLPAYKIKQEMNTALQTDKKTFYFQHQLKNGEIKEVEITTSPIYVNKKKVLCSIIKDLTPYKKIRSRLEDNTEKLIDILSSINEFKMEYKKNHGQKVARLATAIANKMKLYPNNINILEKAAKLHDVGLITIPTCILNKTGKLNKFEYDYIKTHPQMSHDILKELKFDKSISIAEIVLQHHERIDGSGYPAQLSGGEILTEAKILGVADVVISMRANRPHRRPYSLDFTLNKIYNDPGFDKDIVNLCIKLVQKNYNLLF